MQVPESAYRTGSWFAGVTGTCAVLVEDSLASDRVSDLWRQMSQGAPLEQLIDVISGGRFAGIPSFAMAAIVPDGLRIIVRRGATVSVTTDTGEVDSREGQPTGTWNDCIVRYPTCARLSRSQAPQAGLRGHFKPLCPV